MACAHTSKYEDLQKISISNEVCWINVITSKLHTLTQSEGCSFYVAQRDVFIGLVSATGILNCRVSQKHDIALTQSKALIGRLPSAGTEPVVSSSIFIVVLHVQSLGDKTEQP